MRFQKIGFYGLGLIGGSIAKTLHEKYPECTLIATSGRESTVAEAHAAGVIENGGLLDFDAFSDCDLIFLCAPVGKNIEALRRFVETTGAGTLLTDVGSVKGTIHEEAARLKLTDRFIGGHPMTGSEKTGFSNSAPLFLENAYYLLTPEPDVPKETVEEFRLLVDSLGAIPLVLDANDHDRDTAAISHLPHVIAASLVNLVREEDDESEILKRLAAGGFRDITRIASSSPEMWESICIENRAQILKLIDDFSEELKDIQSRIEKSDATSIREFFANAKDYRDSLQIRTGRKAAIHELFMDMDDKEGQIALTTTILAIAHINLKNIGILHNREFEQGVLHLEFYDDGSLRSAADVLKNYGYTIYLR